MTDDVHTLSVQCKAAEAKSVDLAKQLDVEWKSRERREQMECTWAQSVNQLSASVSRSSSVDHKNSELNDEINALRLKVHELEKQVYVFQTKEKKGKATQEKKKENQLKRVTLPEDQDERIEMLIAKGINPTQLKRDGCHQLLEHMGIPSVKKLKILATTPHRAMFEQVTEEAVSWKSNRTHTQIT